jgi:hypothetical protein
VKEKTKKFYPQIQGVTMTISLGTVGACALKHRNLRTYA